MTRWALLFLAAALAFAARAENEPQSIEDAANAFAAALREQSVASLTASSCRGVRGDSSRALAEAIVARFPVSLWRSVLITDLASGIGHADPFVRQVSADILVVLGRARPALVAGFLPELKARLADPNESSAFVYRTLEALALLGPSDPDAVKSLLPALAARLENPSEKSEVVRRNIRSLLAGLDPTNSLSAVRRFPVEQRPAPPCREATSALAEIGGKLGLTAAAVAAWTLVPRHSARAAPVDDPPEALKSPETLLKYHAKLGPAFLEDLAKLGKDDHWLDVDSGEAFAPKEYLSRLMSLETPRGSEPEKPELQALRKVYEKPVSDRARVTAVAKDPKRNIPEIKGHLRVLKGSAIDEVPSSDLIRGFGRPTLISDPGGAFVRHYFIDSVLRTWARISKKGGKIYLYSDDVERIKITRRDRMTVTLGEWLLGLHEGLQVRGPAPGEKGPFVITVLDPRKVKIPVLARLTWPDSEHPNTPKELGESLDDSDD